MIWENGIMREETPEELAQMEQANAKAEAEYWATIGYDEAVDTEIRKKYSMSAEFAILRQKDEKPEEYKAYYDYCEACKSFVKQKKGIV